jgi:hypothetical protein
MLIYECKDTDENSFFVWKALFCVSREGIVSLKKMFSVKTNCHSPDRSGNPFVTGFGTKD